MMTMMIMAATRFQVALGDRSCWNAGVPKSSMQEFHKVSMNDEERCCWTTEVHDKSHYRVAESSPTRRNSKQTTHSPL